MAEAPDLGVHVVSQPMGTAIVPAPLSVRVLRPSVNSDVLVRQQFDQPVVVAVQVPGTPGRDGLSTATSFVPLEFVATADGAQALPLPSPASAFYALYRNGIRQARASYQVTSQAVIIPAEMLIVAGDQLAFDYTPAA